jgi:hypothetical protein
MKKQLLFVLAITLIAFNVDAQITSVALVGEASGGWPGDPGNPGPSDTHQMNSTDGVNWTLSAVTLTNAATGGGVKFRANNAWTINWGSSAFPTGTATLGGSNISCLAGTFDVTFNSTTGAYSFSGTPIVFPTIAIVGAGAGGWPVDPQVDSNQMSTTDGTNYSINSVGLTANDIKFRQNNNWTVSWGGASFPTGPTNAALNITVTIPGHYRGVFNRTTGVYTFDFPSIAIVGEAVGGWPGDPGNPGPTDVHQLTTTDGETYTLNNLVVTTATSGGGAKFRQDNSWTTSWGSAAFPSASTSTGNNILTVAGIYDVTFNRSTGAYNFTSSLSNTNFSKSDLIIIPNPTNSSWNFSTYKIIESIVITDILGKTIINLNNNQSENIIVDASQLNSGIYFAKIVSENQIQTIKLIKN